MKLQTCVQCIVFAAQAVSYAGGVAARLQGASVVAAAAVMVTLVLLLVVRESPRKKKLKKFGGIRVLCSDVTPMS